MDFVSALGKLLTSHRLRQEFSQNRLEVLRELNVSPVDYPAFLNMDLAQLEVQARILIGKRWHELGKLIPRTMAKIGEDGKEVFDFYADQFWPEGHQRHLVDALNFCRFLDQNKMGQADAAELRRLKARLRR